MFPHFPPNVGCKWCGVMSMAMRPTKPCLRCLNWNNARMMTSTMPLQHVRGLAHFTDDIMHSIACFFIPWHDFHAQYCRQYMHGILIMHLSYLSRNHSPICSLTDRPLEIILDMLYDDAGPDVTPDELAAMPTPP